MPTVAWRELTFFDVATYTEMRRKILYFSMVRDPIDRFASYYTFAREERKEDMGGVIYNELFR